MLLTQQRRRTLKNAPLKKAKNRERLCAAAPSSGEAAYLLALVMGGITRSCEGVHEHSTCKNQTLSKMTV
jgi:hypothetical protein